MIKLETSDGLVWNYDDRVVDLIIEASQHQQVTIDLNGEGPCLASLNLIPKLERLCQEFNWPREKFHIRTCNVLEDTSQWPMTVDVNGLVEIRQGQQLKYTANKTIEKHFGIFIGRSNSFRLWLTSLLYNDHRDRSTITFHYDYRSDFHRDNLGIDRLLPELDNISRLDEIANLIKSSPIGNNPTYPILCPQNFDVIKQYDKIFLDVACETYFTGQTFFPTEKTWRSIISCTPFVVQGPIGYLKNLKRLGFKTFDQYWSEEYDAAGGALRLYELKNVIDYIGSKNVAELDAMYQDMLPVLQHNQQVFKELTFKKIKEEFNV